MIEEVTWGSPPVARLVWVLVLAEAASAASFVAAEQTAVGVVRFSTLSPFAEVQMAPPGA